VIQESNLPRRVLNLGLVAADDPLVFGVLRVYWLAAILYARVPVLDAERAAQLKIPQRPAAPNQKRIPLRDVFLRRLPAHDAVVDRPQARIALPAAQVGAIEQRLHIRRLRRRLGGHILC
jgi:hypothetical protein